MFTYTVIRSRRRSAALEITKNCNILVRVPLRFPQRDIAPFVASHEKWLTEHLASQQARKAKAPPPPTPEALFALKAKALAILPEKVRRYSEQTGLIPTGIKITSARTRYGSCSSRDSLCFSCFLMDCPDASIDLVVVHELCHIRHKNHGPQFYALLGSILPDYQERKKLLFMR